MKQKYILLATALLLVLGGLLFFRQEQNDIGYYSSLSKEELSKLEKFDRPDLAQVQNFQMTKDPSLGYPPMEKLLSISKDIEKASSNRSSSNWVERGPNNFGGRTRAIMFDPNDQENKKVWAGGVGGGLWYNNNITDVNSSWKVVDDFFGNIAISAMAYDPTDTDVFYFGTGEGWFNADAIRGNGIWKSSDGGITWSPVASTQDNPEFHYVQKIVVTDEGTVLATTRDNGGIFRSEDGGDSWTRVLSVARGADLEINNQTVYASTGIFSAGNVYRSDDDGLTWETITPVSGLNRIELGVHPNHPDLIYALGSNSTQINGIYKSNDKGETWETLTVPPSYNQNCSPTSADFTNGQAWYNLIVAVSPSNPDEVLIGGLDLNKSEDGGRTWSLISYWTGACDDFVHADQHNFIFRPGHPNEAIGSNDGGITYTTNFSNPLSEGGPNFEDRNKDYNVAQFYACAMENEIGSDYFLAGSQDNGSHQFFTTGVNSTVQVTGGDGAFCFIDQDDSDIQITSYVYNSYWITTDFWQSAPVSSLQGNVGQFINPADYNSNTNILYAAGDGDQLVRYDVNDATITPEVLTLQMSSEQISAVKVSDFNDDLIFVGTTSGSIYKVLGATGTNPVAVDISGDRIPSGIYISSIDIGVDDKELLVVASNFGIESVYHTTDEGLSWESKEGNLPDMPIRWGIFNPSNRDEVILATELGVWMTSSLQGENPVWESINDGLANVRCDMIKYRAADGLVAVATHGRGLYTSDIFASVSVAKFSSADIVYLGQSISFENASILADSFSWDFGNGETSTVENPTVDFTTPGVYDVVLEINGDATKTYTKSIAVLPFFDTSYATSDGGDFESNQSHFFSVSERGGTPFELGNSSIVGKSGVNSGVNAWVTGLTLDTYAPNGLSFLYTPQFDFSLSGEYTLEFYTKYMIEDEWDGFIVEYSTDNGSSWNKLGNYLDVDNWHNQEAISTAVVFQAGEPIFSGDTNNEFVKKSITFSELSGNEKVAFRFAFRTDPGSEEAGVAIDDFAITLPTESDPSVSFVSSSGVSCEGEIVTFQNKSIGDIESYSWTFGEGAIPASADGFGPHEVVYSTTGDKDIVLTANSNGEILTFTEGIIVTSLPQELSFAQSDFTICEGESVVIHFTSPEESVTYTLIDKSTDESFVDPIVSDGSDFEIVLDELTFGLYSLGVIASLDESCQVDFSVQFSVNVQKFPDAEITQIDLKTLSASAGESYQWYLNGSDIANATEKVLEIAEPGIYTVDVTTGNCTTSSEDFVVQSVLGLNNDYLSVELYPNPVEDWLTLNLDKKETVRITIVNLSGSLVYSDIYDAQEIRMDLSQIESGLYLLTINGDRPYQSQLISKK